MSIMERLENLARGLSWNAPSIPANVIPVSAERLADRVLSTGKEDCWNAYRLFEANDVHPRSRDGKHWPFITSVSYLAKGEDGVPSIYIRAEDDPRGCFPVELDEMVWIVPPNGREDIEL